MIEISQIHVSIFPRTFSTMTSLYRIKWGTSGWQATFQSKWLTFHAKINFFDPKERSSMKPFYQIQKESDREIFKFEYVNDIYTYDDFEIYTTPRTNRIDRIIVTYESFNLSMSSFYDYGIRWWYQKILEEETDHIRSIELHIFHKDLKEIYRFLKDICDIYDIDFT